MTTIVNCKNDDDDDDNNKNINILDSSREFSMNLYEKCAKLANDKSMILSPFSIHTSLTLLYNGANNETSTALSKNLYFGTNNRKLIQKSFNEFFTSYLNNDNSLIQIANAIYIDQTTNILPEFKKIAIENFHSNIENVDFSDINKTTNLINNWVKNKTNDKITNIINENDLKSDIKLIILNAIHFKGVWYAPFDKSLTKKENFWINNDEAIEVDMMHHSQANYKLHIKVIESIHGLDASAIELPYDKSNLSMVIILPKKRMGLNDVEMKLKNHNLKELFDKFKLITSPFSLKLPKFKFEHEIDLKKPLIEMGLDILFSSRADFSNLSPDPLLVSKGIHKAFINVDEEGTEAAALTAIVISSRSYSFFDFHADHPFICIIKDNNGQIFFIGRVTGSNF